MCSSSRNTPTRVGKTCSIIEPRIPDQKHPHARGEDLPIVQLICTPLETPPRAWGRPANCPVDLHAVRNTPTRVGKTKCPHTHRNVLKKHPHARGEDLICSFSFSTPLETPPRAWGRRYTKFPGNSRLRNTPTRVGKTGWFSVFGWPYWKHPHARGEDTGLLADRPRQAETPPRAWGRLSRFYTLFLFIRNTPTRVGKTYIYL